MPWETRRGIANSAATRGTTGAAAGAHHAAAAPSPHVAATVLARSVSPVCLGENERRGRGAIGEVDRDAAGVERGRHR